MNNINFVGLFFICFIHIANGGNLLIVHICPFASYTNLVTGIVHTLAPYHNITLLSIAHNPFNHPNVTLVKLNQPDLHIVSKKDIFEQLASRKKFDLIRKTLLSITKEYIDDTFNKNKILLDLIKNEDTYDLFFCFTHLSEHLLPLAHVLKASFIQLSPTEPLPWQSDSVGNPIFLSTAHTLITDEDPDYLSGRICNFVKHLILTVMYYWYYIPYINTHSLQYYPEKTPQIQEILSNTSLLIVNTVEAMGFSRPTESNTIEVGGLHCRNPQNLPEEIAKFIDKSGEAGFIYISFGTTISATFPEKFTDILINVLSKLPYQILWKSNRDMKTMPPNILVSKWFPQQDILGHPKIKLFITHGGMLSLQEAVYHAVPLLIIPITFDQPFNAYRVKKIGYGRYLHFPEVTEFSLLREIQHVTSNKSYKVKINELSKLMRDQSLSSAEKLKWWINYIIRYNGFPLYRTNVNKYSWMKVVEIDVLVSFIFVFVVVFYLVKKILYRIINVFNMRLKFKTQ